MDNRIEQQIKLDLEMALAQVRATIKAECRVTKFEVNDESFFFEITVGENYGFKKWRYLIPDTPFLELTVDVEAFELGIKTKLEMYQRGDEHIIEQSWNQMVVQIVNRFFHHNPEYQKAIIHD